VNLAKVLFFHKQLQEITDANDNPVDHAASELSDAEGEMAASKVATTQDALQILDFGIYLCDQDRLENQRALKIFTSLRKFLSSAA